MVPAVFGDFVALMGAITVFPLAFVLTLLMYNKVSPQQSLGLYCSAFVTLVSAQQGF